MTRIVEPPVAVEADSGPTELVSPSSRWPDWLPRAGTLAVIAGVIAVTVWQLHPSLLFANTTTTGGDTGAHFVMPAYLKSHLLGSGRLTGWDPSWYDGYPIYTFYFVVSDLLAALASYVIPYGIAFKLMTVLGSVLLPVAAWWCGRLFRLRSPGPAALAAATLPFLFDYTWTIYGGNLFSTLAGEYAYSLAIPLALVFLGLFARGLRTGTGRGWAALVLALCILTHIIPAALALVGALVLLVFELVGRWVRWDDDDGKSTRPSPLRSLWWGASTVLAGVALSSWWLVPFLFHHDYSTQMGYQNVTTFGTLLFPGADLWALGAAAVATLFAIVTRSRFGLLFSILGGLSALGLIVDPQGALYNVRLLPLWFLCVYLMVGWFAAAIVRWVALAWRDRRRWIDSGRIVPVERRYRWAPGAAAGPIALLVGALVVVVPPFVLPASALPVTVGANQVSAWATYNYSGYEEKASYPEFKALMATMSRVGATHGCGRAMWEYNADENRFGTPEALMDLAYFTGGCIDSMEGLLFESSTTTPYHFLNQSELSVAPSDPMVGLPYGPVDVPLGIEHLQLLGVRYFMAFSPVVVREAKSDPALRLVATTGPWRAASGSQLLDTTWAVFEVRDPAPVVSLRDRPAVLTGVGQGQSGWLTQSVAWYDHPSRWPVELTATGPAAWQRVTKGETPQRVPVPAAGVSAIKQSGGSISFHVRRLGTPVLVKTSYFPDWQARGASGPWRATPNLMVVIPTSHTVTLTYGSDGIDNLGLIVSGLALVALLAGVVVRRRRPGHHGARAPDPGRPRVRPPGRADGPGRS